MSAPEAPPFEAPWQAQLFALTVALNEAGHFAWADWAERFGARRAEGPAADASDYFDHWLDVFEGFVAELGLAESAVLAELAASWRRAAEATPHGVALALENDPLGGGAGETDTRYRE
ncbi:nitrile hydratase accessory protein [Algicella marina]|uniref:nitrile hydratase accessory protein n=1 Tax=Algicella marina TaxID=2683284 RepID=UPI0024E00DAE|nr:nitrile hydratase accessory protein [Algicella marina]